ncbi:MAG: PEGA domain-containing protein [Opitutaceae bacterium]
MNTPLLIRLLLVVLGIAAVSLCTGCATIVKGTTQEVPVSSEPAGARVSVDGSAAGTTPTTVTLSRKANHMVTIEKDGYQLESVAITKSMGGAVAGNIIAGGLVGWGVDAVSGAQYNLNPTTVNVRLQPVAEARSAGNGNGGNATRSFVEELNKLDGLLEQGKLSSVEHRSLRTALIDKFQK